MLAKNFTLEEPSEYFTMWRMQIRNETHFIRILSGLQRSSIMNKVILDSNWAFRV